MHHQCEKCGSSEVYECRWVNMNDNEDFCEGPIDYLWCNDCDQECTVVTVEPDIDPGEMDGDHESALTSAGLGTDESYGGERDVE